MGLVDYSESDSSDNETPAQTSKSTTQSTTRPPPKKAAFQKVVDRSNPGKIVLNLPQPKSESTDASNSNNDEPPAKRARTGGGGGLFSGLNSFLPAPKNANKSSIASGIHAKPKPGVNLKTSAEPGFSRDTAADNGDDDGSSSKMSLPPPKKQAATPSIPEEQKPAEEVKLVGKPLMFRPLSVARNQNKKKKKPAVIPKPDTTIPSAQQPAPAPAPAPAPKKVSLFSLHTEEPSEPTTSRSNSSAYEPLFTSEDVVGPYADLATTTAPTNLPTATFQQQQQTESIDSIADDLNLTASQRRELFGRGGLGNSGAGKVVNFNMDKEYQHNQEIMAAGEQQIHKAVRSINAEGKHSLKQLVQNAQSQKEALEDSFAKGKSNRAEASSRYGW